MKQTSEDTLSKVVFLNNNFNALYKTAQDSDTKIQMLDQQVAGLNDRQKKSLWDMEEKVFGPRGAQFANQDEKPVAVAIAEVEKQVRFL